jgi:hypothetical protein
MGNDAFEVLTLPTFLVGAWGMALGLGPLVLQVFDRLLIDGVEQDEEEQADAVDDSASRDDLARFGLCGGAHGADRRDEMGLLPASSGVASGLRPWM